MPHLKGLTGIGHWAKWLGVGGKWQPISHFHEDGRWRGRKGGRKGELKAFLSLFVIVVRGLGVELMNGAIYP